MAQTLADVQRRLVSLYKLYDQIISNGGVVQKTVTGASGGDHSMSFMTLKQVQDQIKEYEEIEAALDPTKPQGGVAYSQFMQPG